MNANIALDESQLGLSSELAEAVRTQRLGSRTIQTYQHWITQYLAYFNLKNPRSLSEANVREFLGYLVKSLLLSRARLNQARESLFFLYDKVLKKPLKQSEIDVLETVH